MCDQQRLRPACAYAQSDQSLCKSLEYFMNIQLLAEHHLEFLSFKGGCTGSSESTLVKIPHCWKSHVTAHFIYNFLGLSLYFAYLLHRKEKLTGLIEQSLKIEGSLYLACNVKHFFFALRQPKRYYLWL